MEKKTFAAQLDQLHDMLEFIQHFAWSLQMSEVDIEKLILAAEEALVNIVSYGYPGKENGYIELTCGEANRRGIQIIIKDQGVPFNPLENVPALLPHSDEPVEKKELGGLGIYILSRLMDEVEYQRVDNENMLKMVKFF